MSKKILVVYTGGTIGMVKDSKTGALTTLKNTSFFESIPELQKMNCSVNLTSIKQTKDSSSILPSDWLCVASLIAEKYALYDGFVLLHGTDTMAYTASALSFLFRNLAKPVVLTGSQLPSGLYRSDAKDNIVNAIEIASSYKEGKAVVPEVCLCFENNLFRGNRAHKNNVEHFNAFQSTNYPSLAHIGVNLKFNESFILPFPKGSFKFHNRINTNVAVLKIFPGINKETVGGVLSNNIIKGVVLESFGSGNIPNTPWLIRSIEKAIQQGKKIVNISQCASGSVNQTKYSSGYALEKAGVISGFDMTLEAALTKMMFLLGNASESESFKALMQKSLRGEHSY